MSYLRAHLIEIPRARIEAMIEAEAAQSGCPIEVGIYEEYTDRYHVEVWGRAHAVMRLIGLLADHGEDCLRGVE